MSYHPRYFLHHLTQSHPITILHYLALLLAKVLSHLILQNPSQQLAVSRIANLVAGAAKNFLHRCQESTMCCSRLVLTRRP